jgi:hypothetical protein
LPAGSLSGKVALIRRGTCGFYVKSFNAQTAGAIGVVLYNNVAGRVSPTVAGAPPITIPVVAISDTEGALIDSRLAAGPVDMTWTANVGKFVNPTGGLISSFSSYGLAADLSLKPNIAAPGGSIYSTYPLELGRLCHLVRHVDGVAACGRRCRAGAPGQAEHAVHRHEVAAAELGRSEELVGAPSLGFLDNVHRQGAGMLDIPGPCSRAPSSSRVNSRSARARPAQPSAA